MPLDRVHMGLAMVGLMAWIIIIIKQGPWPVYARDVAGEAGPTLRCFDK